MARKTQQSWMDIGLKILGREGASAITIDRMTAALGVTKGSFYHHFKNINGFKESLLDAWEKDSLDIITAITEKGGSVDILTGLIAEFEKRSPLPEIAIRAWAVEDPAARSRMEKLDALRISFLTVALTQILGDAGKGRAIAHLIYTSIIGSLALHPPLPIEQLKIAQVTLFHLLGLLPPMEASPNFIKGDQS